MFIVRSTNPLGEAVERIQNKARQVLAVFLDLHPGDRADAINFAPIWSNKDKADGFLF